MDLQLLLWWVMGHAGLGWYSWKHIWFILTHTSLVGNFLTPPMNYLSKLAWCFWRLRKAWWKLDSKIIIIFLQQKSIRRNKPNNMLGVPSAKLVVWIWLLIYQFTFYIYMVWYMFLFQEKIEDLWSLWWLGGPYF